MLGTNEILAPKQDIVKGQRIGIQKPSNPLKKVLESAVWNPESKTVLDSLI